MSAWRRAQMVTEGLELPPRSKGYFAPAIERQLRRGLRSFPRRPLWGRYPPKGEVFSTFGTDLGEVSLQPGTGGVFVITYNGEVI
jgi:hypothetical protein